MPNRVAQLRSEIEAAHPGAALKHRSKAGFVMLRPDGVEEHRYTTGPWHWRQHDGVDWQEIDTDLEDRPDGSRGVKSARFDSIVADDGSRRFIPRRWIPGEYVEFGPLEWNAGVRWVTTPLGTLTAQRPGLGNLVEHERPTHSHRVGFSGVGCRTELVLKSAAAARPLRWSVTLSGVDWKDGVLVSQKDGVQVGFIRPPSWTDATGREPVEIPWEYAGGYVTSTPDLAGAVYPVTIDPDYSIAAGADDGYALPATSTLRDTYTSIIVGQKYSIVSHTWLRFAGIAAAQGQTAATAYVTFKVYSAQGGTNLDSKWYGVDETDADHEAPTTYAEWATDHGIHTSASATEAANPPDTAAATWTSVSLTGIIDELLANANWQTGYDIGLHLDDNGSSDGNKRSMASYEHVTYTEPVLSLTLAAAGTDDEATLTTLPATGSFPAVTTANNVNATTTPTVLAASSTFPSVTASVDADASLTALTVSATLPTVTAVGEANAAAAVPVLAVHSTLPVAVTGNDVNAAAPLSAFLAQATFDPVTATGGTPAPLEIFAVTVSIDPVTVKNDVAATAVPSPLPVAATFPSVNIQAGADAYPQGTALPIQATFPTATPIGEVNAAASPAVLLVGGTLPATTTTSEVNATAAVAALLADITLASPAVTASSTAGGSVLGTAVSFPYVSATGGGSASPPLTILPGTGTFPTVTLTLGAETAVTALTAAATFPTPTVTATSNADVPVASSTVSSTFPPVTASISVTATPSTLAVSGSFPASDRYIDSYAPLTALEILATVPLVVRGGGATTTATTFPVVGYLLPATATGSVGETQGFVALTDASAGVAIGTAVSTSSIRLAAAGVRLSDR